MKHKWATLTRLGDIFKTAAGGTPSTTKREYYDGGKIPWLNSGEVRQGVVRGAKTFITDLGLKNSNARIFPKNTVLVALYGATAGQVGILDIEAATNQALLGIYPNSNYAPKFVFYLLLSQYDHLVSQAVGNAQPNLSGLKIKDTMVPSVSLPEQHRIVGILDKAFAGIATAKANAEKNLQNARAIFESHLNDVFTKRGKGWNPAKLGEIFDITSSKRVFESDWRTEGVPFYRAREIVRLAKQGFVDNELFISEEMFDRYSKKYGVPVEGDIMVTGVGTLGICHVVREKDRFYFKDGNIIWLKKKADVNSHFVEHAFRSEVLRRQIDDSIGATVGTYTIIKAKNTLIPMPPVDEQRRVVAELDASRRNSQQLESIYKQKLAALEELQKSLLHQAFAGEL